MKTSKKTMSPQMRMGLIIGGSTIILLAVVAILLLRVILPVTFKIDTSLISVNPNYDISVMEIPDGFRIFRPSGSDKDFKVIDFTDMHLDHKEEVGNITLKYFMKSLSDEKPDFVIVNGDIITSSLTRNRAHQFAKLMEEYGIYWTYVLGNHEHDNFWSASRDTLIKLFAEYPHALVKTDPTMTVDGEEIYGVNNEVIEFAGADGKVNRIFVIIDSGQKMTEKEVEKYCIGNLDGRVDAYIQDSQIRWFTETVTGYGNVQAAVFAHIPLPDMDTAFALAKEGDPSAKLIYGDKREGICFSAHNSGFFNAMKKVNADSYICGHDHVNDFQVEYEGILLAYCQSSGFSSYSTRSKKLSENMIQGYTLISVSKNGEMTLESKTYEDLYPEDVPELHEYFIWGVKR